MLRVRHPEDQLAAVVLLLCAGISTYRPLRHWNVGAGHMGIKIVIDNASLAS